MRAATGVDGGSAGSATTVVAVELQTVQREMIFTMALHSRDEVAMSLTALLDIHRARSAPFLLSSCQSQCSGSCANFSAHVVCPYGALLWLGISDDVAHCVRRFRGG